ncbi:MAG: glycosyltransferase family 39 protein, partial [candidate division Zixibacteria bacterium]|nr:glycosyltransferase family 39 protein [candidate division Zixibacteria bacterium]
MKQYIKTHPLRFVLIAALLVRLTAGIFSQGFIYSDDHYDTVAVSYDWVCNGLWGDDGHLRWKTESTANVGRFPLYALSLYAPMKACEAVGINGLDKMMYVIRLIHALLSLLPVWAIYRITQQVTRRQSWAVYGGLAAGLHFALPFLGVRNLIEMVGGEFWIVAIYFLYRFLNDKQFKWLSWAAVFSGLAWMIRFQMAFAVAPIPFVLWYQTRRIKPAIWFSAGVAAMILLSGIIDLYYSGAFAASTINNLRINTGLTARYNTIPFLYPLVLLAFFIPPFSLIPAVLAFRPGFWKRHLLLAVSTAFFIAAHMLHSNQQERFMIPVVPACLLIGVLALWDRYQTRGYILKPAWLLTVPAGMAVVANLILLPPATLAYPHKGLIEPMIWIERMDPKPKVLVFQPNMKNWIPTDYARLEPLQRKFVRAWPEIDILHPHEIGKQAFDRFILYPVTERDREAYLESIQ